MSVSRSAMEVFTYALKVPSQSSPGASSKDAPYRHNDFDVRTVHMHENECPNGHSHCQHLVLGSSETIPIIEGKMSLGEWQRIFMVELDGMKGEMVGSREVVVQIVGLA